MELRHGYTLSDLHQMTAAAVKADRLLAMDYRQRWDIAYSAITLALFEAEHWPRRESLIQAGWKAIYRHVRDGLRERGYADDRDWSSADPTMPRFVQFWGPRVVASHEDRIVERLAAQQVMTRVTGAPREAVLALAACDDYPAAAEALGISYTALTVRLSTARRQFLGLWHEGETPHRPRRTDRRVEAHGKELDTHCGGGHEWSPENTRTSRVTVRGRVRTRRTCRACEHDRGQRRTALKEAS